MPISMKTRTYLSIIKRSIIFLLFPFVSLAQPSNDVCGNAVTLVSGISCSNTAGTLRLIVTSATATAGISAFCGNAGSADVWYLFVAQTAYPTITLSSMGTSMDDNPRLQIFNTTSCTVATLNANSLACVSGTATSTLSLNTASSPGGAGLTVGTTYLVRVFTGSGTAPSGTSSLWNFNICVTDPSPGQVDYSKSYINVTKGTNGGSVEPGDILELRATFVVKSKSVDSLAYYDTLFNTRGFKIVTSTISTKTNEGKTYGSFSDAADTDPGDFRQTGSDTAIRINVGLAASGSARGKIRNTSRPSFYGGTCIIMATYRVQVYAPYGTKIRWGGGKFTYRDTATGVLSSITFKNDSLIVYSSPGLCPNAVSATNAVGVETNGTFGIPPGAAPFARNRGTSTYVPGYIYNTFTNAGGPQDYYYGIANNTSARFSILQNWRKPDASSPSYRVFSLWDIIGDHTGAANTSKGNIPCDTTLAVSATNPCGYMLVINSAYKTDTAFQYTVTNLCPNTYYEISAWVRNICYRCGCDSMGRGSSSAGYIPFATGDSSGVQPNMAFDIDGTDYYTTGNVQYFGTDLVAPRDTISQASDTLNKWIKRGFTYLTGTSQTSFKLTIRNNAPGGGGNDWAMDDISVATCLPNMRYSPSLNPNVCRLNPLTIYDTVRSYFNNYVYYKWQRSTDNGATWADATGALGPATPTWNGTAWEYVTSYTITPADTDTSDNGDRYRVIVATTAVNLSNTDCQFTDGVSIINLSVTNCGIPLKTDLLSFSGLLVNEKGTISWTTSKEDKPLTFTIERSNDGATFTSAGSVKSHDNYTASVNSYSFIDPVAVPSQVFYRLVMTGQSGVKKYSRTIQLSKPDSDSFALVTVVNPFNYSVEFDVSSSCDAKIEAELIDLTGKVVQKNSFQVYAGINALSLPNTENLPSGTYIFRLKNNEIHINRKVIKRTY
jgi:trimeric autotransporter adhesin